MHPVPLREDATALSAGESHSLADLEAAFDLLPDAVLGVAWPAATISLANSAALAALGYQRRELLGLALSDILPATDLAALTAHDRAVANRRTMQQCKHGIAAPADWRVSRASINGQRHWIVVARNTLLLRTEEDAVGEALRELDHRLGQDALTGLPDRRLFHRRLSRALARYHDRGDCLFAVCFVDLDEFKAINDELGHLAGDRVLREVACRLADSIRPGDMAARYGGDEFTILVDDLSSADDAMRVAWRILRQLASPVTIADYSANVSASIGIALASHNCRCIEALLENADRAMYQAKSRGGGIAVLFDAATAPWRNKPR
ncbi:MAG: GGDEF domain-containing protein [Thermoguttaceae bacterium]